MNNFFKITIFSSMTVVMAFFLVVSPVLAETQRPVIEKARNGSAGAAMKEQKTQVKVEKRTGTLQERADREISRRLESLKKLLTRISEFKKLTATQKAGLTTQVQAEIDKLTALQAKIKAATDEATIKADVQSIVTSYRIYALLMPKIEILGAAERLLTVADQMDAQATMLEAKLKEATSEAEAAALLVILTDMRAKIVLAKAEAQEAIDLVTPLTPEGYPGNKTTLASAHTTIRLARENLFTARQDARKIIVGLLQLGKVATSTPTVTIAPEL